MENAILLLIFLFALLALFGLAEVVVAFKNWYLRKPANVAYWSAYARN